MRFAYDDGVPTLQVRNLPQNLYDRIVEAAKREHRSITQQTIVLLSQALGEDLDPREQRRRLLDELDRNPIAPGVKLVPPPEVLIREDRDR